MWTLCGLQVLAVSFGLCWWSCTEPGQPCHAAGTWWSWEEGWYPSFGAQFPVQRWHHETRSERGQATLLCLGWQKAITTVVGIPQSTVKSQKLIYPLWDLISKTKPEILKDAMKCPEENTLLPGSPGSDPKRFLCLTQHRAFLPFYLWGNCDRSVG